MPAPRDARPQIAREDPLDGAPIADPPADLEGQHRREERGRRDVPADLLEQDSQLDRTEPDPALGLAHRDAEPALLDHRGPEVAIPALGGLGDPAHLVGRGQVVQQ